MVPGDGPQGDASMPCPVAAKALSCPGTRSMTGREPVGPERQRAGDGDALLLTAGEPVGQCEAAVSAPDPAQQSDGPLQGLRLRYTGLALGDHDVLHGREMGEEVEALEDHADRAAQSRQVAADDAAVAVHHLPGDARRRSCSGSP